MSGSGEPTVAQVSQLAAMAERHPDEIGYRVLGRGSLTFAEWDDEANRLARGFTARGVAHGDRVAIQLEVANALRWVVAYAAIHKAGAVAVPLDPRLAPTEVAHMVDHARVVATFADGERVARALGGPGGGAPAMPSLRLVVDASINGDTVPATHPRGEGGRPVVLPWDEAVDQDGSSFQVPIEPDDFADIMFTSGTTGRPKGVAVRHVNASTVPNGPPVWGGHLWLHASPLTTFAGLAFVYAPMKLGMTCVYQPRFDADDWLDFVESEGPEAVFLVPAMVQLLLGNPRFEHADFSSVRLCSVGSAPLAPSAIDRLQARLPDAVVSNNYGMTEAGSVYCLMPQGEAVRRPGSVGKPMPPAEVRCVDAMGGPVPPGEYGQIELRIPGRPREYFEDAEATAETWVDGWLRTGDIGRLDDDGYLYIGGRAKDIIIRGGSNIYAVDVEYVILSHAGVAEVAVIGVPHEVLGEDLAAVVVPRRGSDVDADGLRQYCLETLAAYKVPRRWEFVDQLPRNPAGKVLKHELQARFASGAAPLVEPA
ncbi:MAG: class I adenylate-forming enzyme family protein [Acidimicrobiales bacterium]